MTTRFRANEIRGLVPHTPSYRAEILLREAASHIAQYDVFLSHSLRDAQLIYGVRELLVKQGLSVYVDWIDDPQLDRSYVTPATADRLCQRMRRCATLLYVSTRAAQRSRWMPWELGYFDATKGRDRVLIMPIEGIGAGQFDGEEYLGLYRSVEKSGLASPYIAPVRPGGPTESLGSYIRMRRA